MGILGKIARGLVFVVSAPAGTGKTTLVEMILAQHPRGMRRSVSCTTRAPRKHEKNGVDYIFLTEEEFERKVKEGAFLEYAKVFNHYYGTLKDTVSHLQESGVHVFLVIDTQGALFLRKEKLEAVFIFIMPPSIEVLQGRLENRQTESEEAIELRISWAKEEMDKALYYDHVIMNDNLQKAYQDFKAFIEQKEKQLCQYIT